MNKALKYSLIALLVVAVVGITAVGVAYAQGNDHLQPHDMLAELLGLTPDELRDEMQSGASMEDLAEAADVDLDAFWAEMQEAREEEHKDRLQEALDNGDITQEQYDWMLEGFDNGFMGGKGFGGRGGFGNEDAAKPFGGRGSFGHRGNSGSWCGMGSFGR
jgi:uncharacterized protein HemX